MDGREEAASLLERIRDEHDEQEDGINQIGLLTMAVFHYLGAIDEDLQKLRQELQDRNGGEGG